VPQSHSAADPSSACLSSDPAEPAQQVSINAAFCSAVTCARPAFGAARATGSEQPRRAAAAGLRTRRTFVVLYESTARSIDAFAESESRICAECLEREHEFRHVEAPRIPEIPHDDVQGVTTDLKRGNDHEMIGDVEVIFGEQG